MHQNRSMPVKLASPRPPPRSLPSRVAAVEEAVPPITAFMSPSAYCVAK